MKASSMQNHFDVTRSKCRQTKPIVWATLLILMSRHADRSSSSLYLADLRSMQYGCKFATVCVRKGYIVTVIMIIIILEYNIIDLYNMTTVYIQKLADV